MANTSLISPASARQLEEHLTSAFHHVEELVRKRWEILEQSVRKSPTAAILIAVGVGHCLHRLPLRSLLGTQLKLLWALAPPGLLAAAATKAYQVLEERSAASAQPSRTDGSQRGRATKAHQEHGA